MVIATILSNTLVLQGLGLVVLIIGGIRSGALASPLPVVRAALIAIMLFNLPDILRILDIDESAFNAPVTTELVQPDLSSATEVKVELPQAATHQLVNSASNQTRRVIVEAPTQTSRPNIVNLNSEISAN